MRVNILFTFLIVAFGFYSCTGLEESEKNKIRKLNAKKEAIYRNHDDKFFSLKNTKKRQLEPYFWENTITGNIQKITKEYFRCKGSFSNTPIILYGKTSNEKYHYDCNGFDEHSLPVKDEKEFVYPVLIDLLNYVQQKTMKPVVITCGHRCPKHNLYAEPHETKSKHLIGAEVDFFVKGLEYDPMLVVESLKKFYEEKSFDFGSLVKTSSSPLETYENKEVKIILSKEGQKRDFDNRHPYPYLTIEVKYDRDKKKPVFYNWHISHKTVMKW